MIIKFTKIGPKGRDVGLRKGAELEVDAGETGWMGLGLGG